MSHPYRSTELDAPVAFVATRSDRFWAWVFQYDVELRRHPDGCYTLSFTKFWPMPGRQVAKLSDLAGVRKLHAALLAGTAGIHTRFVMRDGTSRFVHRRLAPFMANVLERAMVETDETEWRAP